MKSKLLLCSSLALQAAASSVAADLEPPTAFVTNCQACHQLDQALVGPSLVEIAELYPTENRGDFLKWCIEPQKKRDNMVEMPSMAHIPEEELIEIYEYIKVVTIGVNKVKVPQTDPFASYPAKTRRPRVERTFVPDASPASMVIALPTELKHNVIWDTDRCRLRYISEGDIDSWPYLRSNGNSLALVPSIRYREEVPLFESDNVQFKGYLVSELGFPTLIYQVDDSEITEAISVSGDKIVRTIKGSPQLPNYNIPKNQGESMEVTSTTSGETLTIIHSALK